MLRLVMENAKYYLANRVRQYKQSKPNYKLAIVFDIDDTCLSHYPTFKQNQFKITPEIIDACYKMACSPAITPVLNFYTEVCRENVAAFFITARKPLTPEIDLLAATSKNLLNAGYSNYAGLFLPQGTDAKLATAAYKTKIRKDIEEQRGYKIICNIGDQKSDFDGGYAERTFRIPNQLYNSATALPDLFHDSEYNIYSRSLRY